MRWLHFAINSAVVGCFVVFLVVPLVGQVLFPYRSLEEEICMELHSAIFAPGGPYGEVAPMGLSEEEFAAWELDLAARGDAYESEQVAAVAERNGLSVEEVDEIYLRETLRPGSRCT